MNLAEFAKLKEKVESLRRKRDKSSGIMEELLRQIKAEFGCTSIKEAEEKLEQMKVEGKTMRANLDRDLEQFESKWGELLK